jgi:hypothetical protein
MVQIFGGGGFGKFSFEGFDNCMGDICMMIDVKVCSSTTYYTLLARFGKLPMKLYALRLAMSFQQHLAHLPSSWVVIQATSLYRHLDAQIFET